VTDPLKRRTFKAFFALFAGALILIIAWKVLWRQPQVDGTPKPFRQVLELNGKIWKTLFSSGRINRASHPPADGKIPRVNGLIGIQLDLDVSKWKLEVDTDIQNPKARKFTVTMDELLKLPRTDQAVEFFCIEGWSEDMAFAGVKFSDFVKAYNIEKKPYVGLVSVDEEYYVSIDIESMMHEQTLLAYEMNGEKLRPKNGAPLRLAIPVKYGIKNLKQIGRIFFSDSRPPDYWAEQGYDWYAGL
jgi:DMSO/TMAO reductase YedYZ molybdopterin-dependent catalytic subunit